MTSDTADIKLTAREQQYLVCAFLSNQGGAPAIQPDYKKFADLAGLKSVGSAQTMWCATRKKILAGAGLDASGLSNNKPTKKATPMPVNNAITGRDGESPGELNDGESSAAPVEKKKHNRKPKEEVDGEKPPPRKRAKKQPPGVKVELATSPLVEVFPSPKTALPIKTEETDAVDNDEGANAVTDGEILGEANGATGDATAEDNEAGDLLDQLDQDAAEDS